jgi:hypothetical protein
LQTRPFSFVPCLPFLTKARHLGRHALEPGAPATLGSTAEAGRAIHERSFHAKEAYAHAGSSSRYRGVCQTPQGSWTSRRCVNGLTFHCGSHCSEEDAAHVWDLSAICLGLGTAKLNFPASVYEIGGRWSDEAYEARHVDINEFASIWSNRPKQRALDGVLIVLGFVVAHYHCLWTSCLSDTATTGTASALACK